MRKVSLDFSDLPSEENPKYVGPPPQCVDCSRFVAVNGKGTRRIVERGDYGTLYCVEFQCRRCAEAGR